jgi:hypothetical protein
VCSRRGAYFDNAATLGFDELNHRPPPHHVTLGLAVLASLAASRTDALLGDGESLAAALTGGYHLAFLVGAFFAAAAALLGAVLLRVQAPQAATVGATRPAAAR